MQKVDPDDARATWSMTHCKAERRSCVVLLRAIISAVDADPKVACPEPAPPRMAGRARLWVGVATALLHPAVLSR